MLTRSWQKNSFGLFDYESPEVQSQQLRHQGTGRFMRNEVPKDYDDRKKSFVTIRTQQQPILEPD